MANNLSKSNIIYECDSINNKLVRENELNILEKHENQLYFVIGKDNVSAKKRYYKDLKTLNKDFEALKKLKEQKITKKNNSKTSIVEDDFSINTNKFEN